MPLVQRQVESCKEINFPYVQTQSKYIYIYIYISLLAFLAAGCNSRNDTTQASVSDSTSYNVDSIMDLLSDYPERAVDIIDSAEDAGILCYFDAELLRARFLIHNDASREEARRILERLLRTDNISLDHRVSVLGQLVYLSRLYGDDKNTLQYGMRYIEACRLSGQNTRALVVQADLGPALVHLGRTDEGLVKIDDALAQLDKIRHFTEMDACIRVMKSKMRTLSDLGREGEIIPVGLRMLEKLHDYADHPDDYDDGSSWMPDSDSRPGYIDFYRGQAYAFLTYANACNDTTGKMRDRKAARQWLNKFYQTDYAKTFEGERLISSSWFLLGEYDKMNAFYDRMVQQLGDDTLHRNYCILLHNRAEACAKQGRMAQSVHYWRRYNDLQDYLNEREKEAAVHIAATRYLEQERQLEVEKAQDAEKRMRIVAGFQVLIVLILAVSIVLMEQQKFISRKKDRALSKEIIDKIGYAEDFMASESRLPVAEAANLAALDDRGLFEYLRRLILEENLYLNPYFDRQQLMDRLHLSKERIGAAFSKGSKYPSLTAFVNELRLNNAAKMLVEQPDKPIADVAAASGFTSASVFARNFKQRYVLTPSQFRESKTSAQP